MHTGPDSRFLPNNYFSAVSWPILMPNTTNYGFFGSRNSFSAKNYRVLIGKVP